jgi:threonine synthase
MAHQWRGVIREYFDRLDVDSSTPIITLGEGGTPLIEAPTLAKLVGADQVYLKYEGMNPTGSFKDRGMTMAVSKAVGEGAKAVICASTGNTSASAAAYAAAAGITSVVLVPQGKISLGKLSQAVAHKAKILQVQGNFDDCLTLARDLSDNYPVHLVNSVNPDRIEGQKTGAFEVFDSLGRAPDYHVLPVGNAGNYSAYFKGYLEDFNEGRIKPRDLHLLFMVDQSRTRTQLQPQSGLEILPHGILPRVRWSVRWVSLARFQMLRFCGCTDSYRKKRESLSSHLRLPVQLVFTKRPNRVKVLLAH